MGFITFITMLTLVFVILKCLGRIAWSWVWVLCPIWISVLLVAAVFLTVLVGERIRTGKW